MSATFDPYYKWLGILPKDQPPHHYRLLGLEPFENDLQVIEGAADRQLSYLRKYQSGEHAAACQKLLNEVSRARLCLLKSTSKADYDAQLRQQLHIDDGFPEVDVEEFPSVELERPRSLRKGASKSRNPKSVDWGMIGPWIAGGTLLVIALAGVVFFRGAKPKPAIQETPVVADHTNIAPTPAEKVQPSKPHEAPAATVPIFNLLPLLKPENVILGNWKMAPDRLQSVGYTLNGQITLPVKPPSEYTVHVRGTRLETPNALSNAVGLLLLYGDRRSMFVMDALAGEGTSGLQLLDSLEWKFNETRVPGFLTQIGKPFVLDAIVRKDGIEIRLDDRVILDWHGDFTRLATVSGWAKAPPGHLALAGESQYEFTELTLGPPLPRRPLPGSDLRPGDSVELLPLVDLQHDVWAGPIVNDNGALKTDPKVPCTRFSVPFQVPDEYELVADLETAIPAREFYMGFPMSGGQAGISPGCNGGNTHYLIVDRLIPQFQPDRYATGPIFPATRTKLTATILKNHLTIKTGERTLFDWRGDSRRFIPWWEWTTPGRRITFGTNFVSYRVHSLKLKRLDPALSIPFPSPAAPQNGDLLAIVDLNRDTVSGFWTKENGTLTSTADITNAMRFPAELPANYEFRMQVERKKGEDLLAISLPINGYSAMVTIDGNGGKGGGIEFIEGVRFHENSAAIQYPAHKLPIGQPAIILGRIVGRHLYLEINGQKYLDLDLPASMIDPSWLLRPGWLTPEERLHLAITTSCGFEVREVRFRPNGTNDPPFPPIQVPATKVP